MTAAPEPTTGAHAAQPDRVALVTGGSRGLGRALVAGLVDAGWAVVTDGRDPTALAGSPATRAIAGDVGDVDHRRELLEATAALGRLDLLVLNAGPLGPSPLPRLDGLTDRDLADTLAANVVAPHALTRDALPQLRATGGTVVAITSDAAAEAYEGWGAYGASKAALEHLARVLAEEEPALTVLRVDPGDLRTDMHQAAFPGEDISDRPLPEVAVPGILALVDRRPATGGRWRAQDVRAPDVDAGPVAP